MKRKKLYKCLALSLVVSMAVSSAVYASPSKEGEGSEKAVLMSVSGKAAAVLADSAEGDGSEDPVPVGVWLTTADGKAWYFGGRPVLFFGKRKRILVRGEQLQCSWRTEHGKSGAAKNMNMMNTKLRLEKSLRIREGKGDVEDPDDPAPTPTPGGGSGPTDPDDPDPTPTPDPDEPQPTPSLMHPTPHQNRPRSLPQSRTTLMARIKNLKTEIRRRSASGCPPVLQRYGFSAATLPMFFTMEI